MKKESEKPPATMYPSDISFIRGAWIDPIPNLDIRRGYSYTYHLIKKLISRVGDIHKHNKAYLRSSDLIDRFNPVDRSDLLSAHEWSTLPEELIELKVLACIPIEHILYYTFCDCSSYYRERMRCYNYLQVYGFNIELLQSIEQFVGVHYPLRKKYRLDYKRILQLYAEYTLHQQNIFDFGNDFTINVVPIHGLEVGLGYYRSPEYFRDFDNNKEIYFDTHFTKRVLYNGKLLFLNSFYIDLRSNMLYIKQLQGKKGVDFRDFNTTAPEVSKALIKQFVLASRKSQKIHTVNVLGASNNPWLKKKNVKLEQLQRLYDIPAQELGFTENEHGNFELILR